jgi:hypothetical protein
VYQVEKFDWTIALTGEYSDENIPGFCPTSVHYGGHDLRFTVASYCDDDPKASVFEVEVDADTRVIDKNSFGPKVYFDIRSKSMQVCGALLQNEWMVVDLEN